ncbi:MAG: L,D-transpeptidase family protein [Actinomycetaceae bacterium]|nr:L,D-transpeptidase family protein [Actinomycetaceae bacterium]
MTSSPAGKRKKLKLAALIAGGAIVLSGIGATSGYCAYYSGKAVPGTMVAGIPVTGKTQSQIADLVKERVAAVKVRLEGDADAVASLAQLGYEVDTTATAKKALAPARSWHSRIGGLFSKHHVDPVIHRDETKLKQFSDSLSAKTGDSPVNALVTYQADADDFVVTPGKNGHGIDAATVDKAAMDAIKILQSRTTKVVAKESKPRVTDEDAKKFVEDARALMKTDIAVTYDGETYRPRNNTKATWIKLPTNKFGKQEAPAPNPAAISAWVNKLAGQLKTDPIAGLQNVDSSGKVLVTLNEPTDGAEVSNAAEVSKAAVSAMSSRKPYTGSFKDKPIKAHWQKRTLAKGAENLPYPAAENEKWIDVNLSNHTVSAYIGAQPVRQAEPMVNGAPATPTITGTFRIQRKLISDTMKGDDYVTPNVPYAMYFSGGYALHGAPWRSSFGYAGASGSHGCVNLPVGLAGWLYDWAPVGTTVKVHY